MGLPSAPQIDGFVMKYGAGTKLLKRSVKKGRNKKSRERKGEVQVGREVNVQDQGDQRKHRKSKDSL